MKVHLDFEAGSEEDLKLTGSWEWSKHPSTQVICLAFCVDGGPIVTWTPNYRDHEKVLIFAVKKSAELHAWNAPFEYGMWNNIMVPMFGWPEVPIEQFHCTMATAANAGLPMSLEQAALAANAPFKKDEDGRKVMLRMARPRSLNPTVWWHDTDAKKLETLIAYNKADVEAERALSAMIPRMSLEERQIWLTDQRMNLHGFYVDKPLMDNLTTLTDEAMAFFSQEIRNLTNNEVKSVNTTGTLVRWLKERGIATDTVAKAALTELLAQAGHDPDVKRVLEIRQEAAKSSTAKLVSMKNWSTSDGRIRHMVQYYGAGRTGRWAGRGPQVQNFPRGNVKKINLAIKAVEMGMKGSDLREMFGRPLDVVSSSLRGVLRAAPGNKLAVCDFSQIEARVVCWLAGQQDILDVFASGQDVYVYTAKKINSDNRQLGKVAVLGLGFGMGATKFVDAAATYGITLDPDEASSIVGQWREANSKIQKFWYDCDRAARAAIQMGPRAGMTVGPQKVKFQMGTDLLEGCLLVSLPSGRDLVYRNARLEADDGHLNITYDGVNQYTRKWQAIRSYGGKLVENITQAVARDLMASAMVNIERAGLWLVSTIHDELIVECPAEKADAAFSLMKSIMCDAPDWAEGLPLGGEGFISERYGKG